MLTELLRSLCYTVELQMSASGAVRNADHCGLCSLLGTFQADRGCREPFAVDRSPEDRAMSTGRLLVVEDGFLKLAQVDKWQTWVGLCSPPRPQRERCHWLALMKSNGRQRPSDCWCVIREEPSSLLCLVAALHSDPLSQDHNEGPH